MTVNQSLRVLMVLLLPIYLFGCSDSNDNNDTTVIIPPPPPPPEAPTLYAGAASRSLLPTAAGVDARSG